MSSSTTTTTSSTNQGWFGIMDRLCGCSYMEAQLCSEQETFGGRSTTIPTLWMKEDSSSPVIPRHSPSTITPPDSPQSQQSRSITSNNNDKNMRYNDSSVWKGPSSPTSTATTVTMRTRSVASVDTTKSIARQRTNSSLATVYHPQPGPHSFRRTQTEASSSTDSFYHKRYPSVESDLFHSKLMVTVAFDDDEFANHDERSQPPAMMDLAFKRPHSLRRVQTDSLTKLPPLAGYSSAERELRR